MKSSKRRRELSLKKVEADETDRLFVHATDEENVSPNAEGCSLRFVQIEDEVLADCSGSLPPLSNQGANGPKAIAWQRSWDPGSLPHRPLCSKGARYIFGQWVRVQPGRVQLDEHCRQLLCAGRCCASSQSHQKGFLAKSLGSFERRVDSQSRNQLGLG